MSAPVRESKTSLPPWTCRSFRSDVALRNLLPNTVPTPTPRARRESPTSCPVPSPTFPLAQHRGSFFSLRFELWLLTRVGETYATAEWVHRSGRNGWLSCRRRSYGDHGTLLSGTPRMAEKRAGLSK
jgi:hypothetical protein